MGSVTRLETVRPHLVAEKIFEAVRGGKSFARRPVTQAEVDALIEFYRQFIDLPSRIVSLRELAAKKGLKKSRLERLTVIVYRTYGRLPESEKGGWNWKLFRYCLRCRRRFPKTARFCDICGYMIRCKPVKPWPYWTKMEKEKR